VLTNRLVPPNDGGISLGQAALAVFQASRKADRRETECFTVATESAGALRSAQSP